MKTHIKKNMNRKINYYNVAFNIEENTGEIQIQFENEREPLIFSKLSPEKYNVILNTLNTKQCFSNGKYIFTETFK